MSFDTIARHYSWLERILAGAKLQRCRTAFLDQVPEPKKILLMGEGHGRCLVECCRRFPGAQVTCVDASREMLRVAEKSLGAQSISVKFIHADALAWKPADEQFDLIITNFFLDCFGEEQLEQILGMLAKVADPGASWLIADFQRAERGVKRWRTEAILWLMYRVFRVLARLPARKLTSPDLLLRKLGFRLRGRVESEWELLRSDWWQQGVV